MAVMPHCERLLGVSGKLLPAVQGQNLVHIDVEMGQLRRKNLSAIHEVWRKFFPQRAIQRVEDLGFR
jgi:hypothetical protein